ncbi:hypothetical protein ACFFX1_22300 [Dactylosporangium sucinum]|uniref:Uncharacterized protein n=1 Tax=Dactylosporangium sucinum TaxID=1424081 RepID=A0A917TZ85_9ACTN|nr:hypothetical protein [Dactylosporangium sucinum]GGM45699.1 hypothetical protein GCM10007977_054170 [Dactylosporangium sucinum]
MKRRNLLTAVAAGSIGAMLLVSEAQADPGFEQPALAGAAGLTETTVEPAGGAGLFDVDPDQGNISQSPTVVVTGDVTVLPEDWGF